MEEQLDSNEQSFQDNVHVKRVNEQLNIPDGIIPDLRSLARAQDGFTTEIGSSDTDKIKEKIESALQKQPITTKFKRVSSKRRQQQQPVINTVAGYRVSKPLPDDSHIGWTSFSTKPNPGGSLGILATEKKTDKNEMINHVFEIIASPFHDEEIIVIFIIGLSFWFIVQLGGGVVSFIIGLFFITSYFKINIFRFKKKVKDDIQREFAKIALESSDYEKVDWLNNFIKRFWLIFEPVISAAVIENIDTYLVDYLPSFLDSVRITTFTLGSNPFVIDSVKSFTDTEPNTVCMDWSISFVPDDIVGMTREELSKKENPKVVLAIKLGKLFVGTTLPVLLENMSFKGRLRVKLQFMSKMPHIKLAEVCFMEKPQFDYVLKPLGGETFGFDVNNIPGLQSFVRDQTHYILGPMMYYPNVFSFDIEKFFSGELDFSQANGVLAITVYSCTQISTSESDLNPFIRFFLNEAQELEKTSIVEETRTPHWNETKFLLLHDLESILSMELRTTNSTKKAGKKIARARFDLRDIRDQNDYEFENLDLPMLRRGKHITDLKVDMKYFPVSKPQSMPDGSLIEAEPSNSGILRITLHECKNLGSNTMNPYAIIQINSVDRFQTPTFRRTANPKFERSFESLVLDMTEVQIRVHLIDRNDSGDYSLGFLTTSLMDIMKDQEENEYWWDLSKEGRAVQGRLRMSIQWKPVIMSGLAKMGGSFKTVPVGVVRFSIWSVRNLGKQSPYVRIKSGKQIRSRTEILDNTEMPEWGEFHYVPIHSIREDLVLDVMNWTSGSKDKLLGSTVLHLTDLIKECKDENQNVWYESKVDKLDRHDSLHSSGGTNGTIHYSAEFYFTMMLPDNSNEDEGEEEKISLIETQPELPTVDLHGLPIRYTPDDLIDFSSYGSGVLTIKIHEVKAPIEYNCYCRIMVDSLAAQHVTHTLKGRVLTFNQTSDAFIKDAGFSRVAIELKKAEQTEKDDDRLAYWFDSSERIIQQLQNRARCRKIQGGFSVQEMLRLAEDDEGEWFNLINPLGGRAQICLSFGYSPLIDYKVNPDESLENQGLLTVSLLSATDLKAADKWGTSDPYVKFTINGEVIHKSAVIKKNCNPIWKNETFETPIISRVTASFRIEVFDWNQLSGDIPIGSGGITLRGDMVESFSTHECDIPLDGQAGDTGFVTVRLKWEPQLLLRKKLMGASRRTTTKLGTTAFNWSQPLKNTSTIASRGINVPSRLSGLVNSLSLSNSSIQEEDLIYKSESPIENSLFNGRMIIEILEARGLKGDPEDTNPMCFVYLGNEPIMKTRKVKKSIQPNWNEEFSIKVNTEDKRQIIIKVKDVHTFSASDIGYINISTRDLIKKSFMNITNQWIPLEPKGTGEIHLKVKYSK